MLFDHPLLIFRALHKKTRPILKGLRRNYTPFQFQWRIIEVDLFNFNCVGGPVPRTAVCYSIDVYSLIRRLPSLVIDIRWPEDSSKSDILSLKRIEMFRRWRRERGYIELVIWGAGVDRVIGVVGGRQPPGGVPVSRGRALAARAPRPRPERAWRNAPAPRRHPQRPGPGQEAPSFGSRPERRGLRW